MILDLLWKNRHNPSFLAHMNSLAAHIQSVRYTHKVLPDQPKRDFLEPLTLKAYVTKELKVKELEEEIARKEQHMGQLYEHIKQLQEELTLFKST